MTRSTTLAGAIGVSLLFLVASGHSTPTRTLVLAQSQPPDGAGARTRCAGAPVIARGTDVLDPDHLSVHDVIAIDQQLIRAEKERVISRQGPTRHSVGTRTSNSIVVRVYVHVLRGTRGGAVSRPRIERQVAVMNRAYAGKQSVLGAAAPFIFRLAGVDVTVNANWRRMDEGSVAERHAKRVLHLGGARALNLYVNGSESGLLGWATQPTSYRRASLLDGVVVNRRTLPGGSRGRYSAGDVAVHETGHWLGLFHTFTGRCGNRGDLVADTAAESRPSYACPRKRNTCAAPGRDPIHNFMDYSYDGCMDRFTAGQSARMVRAWSTLRAGPGA